MERRRYVRMATPLRCGLRTARMTLGAVVGTTENVSRNGLLIRWRITKGVPRVPAVGDRLAVALEWPVVGPDGQRHLCCSGVVVRVSVAAGEKSMLVAMKVKRMSFETLLRASPEGVHVN